MGRTLTRFINFISIHVPTRGTTVFSPFAIPDFYISIHVPTRGTTMTVMLWECTAKFQSTSPRGGRLFISYFIWIIYFISIHVPTRGTTFHIHNDKCENPISIHVPTRGTTAITVPLYLDGRISIHVPTRGTTWTGMRMSWTQRFQSTSPRGGRHLICGISEVYRGISIHVPTRGTTAEAVQLIRNLRISIHVPTRGTTFVSRGILDNRSYFNPRPHEGDDRTQ